MAADQGIITVRLKINVLGRKGERGGAREREGEIERETCITF